MNLGHIPDRIKHLPLDERGYPIPWFVAWFDGKPDFRVIDGEKLVRAVKQKLCWICGERMGQHLAFLIGPMCAINRTISEPPLHRECAEFSARVCQFLSLPKKTRDEEAIPVGTQDAASVGLKRNPGAVCLWMTKSYRPFKVENGVLFEIGPPDEIHWYAHGRTATRAEVIESIETGLPLLQDIATKESVLAEEELDRRYKNVMATLLPQEQHA